MASSSLNFAAARQAFEALEQQRIAGQIAEDAYRASLNALRVKDDQGYTWMLQERTGNWYVYRDGKWSPATPPEQESAGPPGPPPPPAATDLAHGPTDRDRTYSAPPLRTPPRAAMAAAVPPPVSPYPASASQVAYPPPVPAAPLTASRPGLSQPADPLLRVEPIVPEEKPRAGARRRKYRSAMAGRYRPGCIKVTWSILKWEMLWAAAGWLAYDMIGQRYPWVLIPVGLLALLFMWLYLRRFRRPGMEGVA